MQLARLEIAKRIRLARQNAKLTQEELATRLGRQQSFVSKIESGEKQADFIDVLLIARVLSLPVEAFIPPEFRGKADQS